MGLWEIKQTIHFEEWFDEADDQLQEDIVENVVILQHFGPHLGRPKVDTLKGASLSNLKELRFNSGDKVIRIFFLFDRERNGVLLIGGDKSGSGDKRFYDVMIRKSEQIYDEYLEEKSSFSQRTKK